MNLSNHNEANHEQHLVAQRENLEQRQRGTRVCRCCGEWFNPMFTEHVCCACNEFLDDDMNRIADIPNWRTYELHQRKES